MVFNGQTRDRLQATTRRKRRILIVDDDASVRRLLRCVLPSDYAVRETESGEEALDLFRQWPSDLVLLDIRMPGLDGYEVCRRLKATSLPIPPQIVMVTGQSASGEQVTAFEAGADDYMVKPIDPGELVSRVDLHFRLRESQENTITLQREIEGHHAELRKAASERATQLQAVQDLAVFTLAKVAESRDNETGNHMTRLREYAQRIATELSHGGPHQYAIDERFLWELYRSSPLHDIGKVGIPDAILLKPGRLAPQEFEVMKRHTVIGANILNEAVMKSSGGGFLSMAALIAQFHHERWDGGGYPAGLVGSETPLPARIVAVADVFDALTSTRPYKQAWPNDRAFETIAAGGGTQFDPSVVRAFEDCFTDLLELQRKHADEQNTVVGAMSFLEYDSVAEFC